MEQGYEGFGVGSVRVRAVLRRLPVAVRYRAKELDGLVDQVGAEVVEDAAAVGHCGGVAPVPEALRPPPFKARFEAADLAQRSFPDELSQRQEVGVPAAVLKYRELHAGVGRPGDERLALGRRRDERLVHHHVQAVGHGRLGEVEMGQRGRSEDHQVKVTRRGRTGPPAWGRSGRPGKASPLRRRGPDPP